MNNDLIILFYTHPTLCIKKLMFLNYCHKKLNKL